MSETSEFGWSRLAVGCGPNAGLMTDGGQARRRRVVAAALESGIDLFDTAAAYGDGLSETNLGRTLAELGATPGILTKVAVDDSSLGDLAGAVVRSVEGSLRRLGVARVNGVTLHNRLGCQRSDADVGMGPLLTPDDVLGPGGVVEGLQRMREAGVVRWFGFTTLGGDRAAIDEVIASGHFDYLNAMSSLLGPLDRGMPAIAGAGSAYDVIGLAVRHGLGVLALRVFGGGLLLDPPPALRSTVKALEALSRSSGTSLTRMALRYVLGNPAVTSAVIGFTEVDHVAEAATAMREGPMPEDEIERIEAIQRAGAG